MTRLRRYSILAALAVLLGPTTAWGRFRMPEEAPVDRLVANVGRYVADYPDDARGHYVLGRVHGLALALKSRTVRAYDADVEGKLPEIDHPFQRGGKGEPPTLATLRKHLAAAVAQLAKAVAMEPENALYRLGYACALEAGAGVAATAPPGREPPELPPEETKRLKGLVAKLAAGGEAAADARAKLIAEGVHALPVLLPRVDDADAAIRDAVRDLVGRQWKEAAIPVFLAAWKLVVESDLAIPDMPLRGVRSLVSYEAGEGYVRLVTERGPKEEEKETLAKVEESLGDLAAKPRRRITPIVFPLDRPRPLADLLAAGDGVEFDLDGDGVRERGDWVRPDTAILVWDAAGRGEIDSGRRLFGSVTWWILWRDGYEPLAALDDDGDGRLAGPELTGLAVWRDADSDGVSDPGEVVPIRRAGIVGLAVRATRTEDGAPANDRGVFLADGRVLPSYDWVSSRRP